MLLNNEYQDRGCSGLQMTCIKSTLHFGDQIKSKCAISSTLNGVKIIHLSVIFLKMRSWVVSLRAESSGSSRTYNLKTSSHEMGKSLSDYNRCSLSWEYSIHSCLYFFLFVYMFLWEYAPL